MTFLPCHLVYNSSFVLTPPVLRVQVYNWDFNVFDVHKQTGGRPLFHVTMALLEDQGLFVSTSVLGGAGAGSEGGVAERVTGQQPIRGDRWRSEQFGSSRFVGEGGLHGTCTSLSCYQLGVRTQQRMGQRQLWKHVPARACWCLLAPLVLQQVMHRS